MEFIFFSLQPKYLSFIYFHLNFILESDTNEMENLDAEELEMKEKAITISKGKIINI